MILLFQHTNSCFKFNPRANLTSTHEEKNTCCTFELLRDIIINTTGEKHMEVINCTVRAGGGGGCSRL